MTPYRLLLRGGLIASLAATAATAGSAPPDAPGPREAIVRIAFAPPIGTPLYYRYSVLEGQSASQDRARIYRLVFARMGDTYDLTATLIGSRQVPSWRVHLRERIWTLLDKPQLFRVSKTGEVIAGPRKGRNQSLADRAKLDMHLELEEILGWPAPAMRVGETRQTIRIGAGDYRDMIEVTLVAADAAEARYRLTDRDDAANARRRATAIARMTGYGGNRAAIDALAEVRSDVDIESRLSRETGMVVDQTARYRIVDAGKVAAGPRPHTVRIEQVGAPEVR